MAQSLARSSVLMGLGTLVSRILGFGKAMLLALAIGVTVGGAADAFDIANKVPNNLYLLLAGGILNAVLVPQIVRASARADGGKDFVNRLLTLSVLLLLGFTLIATACAPLLVRLYSSPQWSEDQRALAVAFALWCLPQIFFYGLYTLLGQVLNAQSSFGPYMWAPVLNNVVAIAGLCVFIAVFGPGAEGQHAVDTWTSGKVALLAGSATLGVVAQALILIWPLKRIGFSYRPVFGFRGVGMRTAGTVAGWTFAAVLMGQLGFIVISRVASMASADAGEVSASTAAYSYAYLIFMLPHSLIAVSLATALFTSLSTSAAANDTQAVSTSLNSGLRLVGLVNTLATGGLIVLAHPLAMLLADGTPEQARALGQVIMMMGLGLLPFSACYLLQRVFYAYEDARTPFFVQLPQTILMGLGTVACGVFLPKHLIVAGIGLVMSLSYVFGAVVSLFLARKLLRSLQVSRLVGAHLGFFLAAACATIPVALGIYVFGEAAYANRLHALITCLVGGSVMVLLYLGSCWVLRVRELRVLITTVRTKIGR